MNNFVLLNDTLNFNFRNWNPDTKDNEYEKFLYFVTLKLSYGYKSNSIHLGDPVFKQFNGFYHRLCMSILETKPTHHRDRWPIAFAFLDVDGTKTAPYVPDWCLSGFHIHAILMIHPSTKKRCDAFIRSGKIEGYAKKWQGVSAIEMQPYDPEKGTVENLISYSSKFVSRGHDDHWRAYPEMSPNEIINGDHRYRRGSGLQ